MAKRFGNVLGAFADGAILFPLIAALANRSSFSSAMLFASAGIIYILSGLWFRVPMPVQPLKAIAIAAVVSGASYLEVRWAGAVLGLFCVVLLLFRIDRFADRVPSYLIHGIQAGLGLMLLRRAFEGGLETFAHPDMFQSFLILGACATAWLVSHLFGLSLLGLLAAGGTIVGISLSPSEATGFSSAIPAVRWDFVLALALPQVVLTSANSVLATHDVAQRYFGEKASRVSISGLLASIGFGNLAVSAVGGLPFCHGSGGVTAHVRGGSYHWSSNLIIGAFCLMLAGAQIVWGKTLLSYPPLLLGILLGVVGYHHVKLAAPSWRVPALRPTLVVMGAVALLSQNLLWSLGFGIITASASYLLFPRRVSV